MSSGNWKLDEDGLPVFNYTKEDRRKITKHQRRVMWEIRKGLCYYCNAFVPYGELTIDHKVPISRAKEFDLVDPYVGKNLAICCKKCNQRKGNRTATEFFDVLGVDRHGSATISEDWRK
jgi:5-methylcytosine-specific restriction endonuclease McrA